jgi:hypothetical protein
LLKTSEHPKENMVDHEHIVKQAALERYIVFADYFALKVGGRRQNSTLMYPYNRKLFRRRWKTQEI